MALAAGSHNINLGSDLSPPALSGSGDFTKLGVAFLKLNSANDSYSGNVTISAGRVDLANGGALGSGSVTVNDSASLTVAGGITVTNPISLSGYGVSGAGAIQSLGGINVYAGPITLLADAGIGVWANSLTISQIANSVFTLRKSGTSPLIVTGTPAFAGSFAVFGGTLQVDGTLPATGSATVSSGATLDGTGTAGEVTVLSGGHFAPGHSPGTITATSLTLNSGALFDEEINGTTAGTLYDVTQVSGTPGTVALGNATLNVTLGYTPAVGDTYAIINATGGVSGTFKDSLGNTLTNGATLTVASQLLRINYTSTTVTLTAVLPTTTVLVSSLNPSTSGSNVTFTSTVSPSAASGTVTFKDGTTTLGTGTLSGGVGVATFTTNGLSGGRRTITAAYGGDGNYNGSVSSPLTQIVAWVPVQSGFWDDTATWGGTLPDAGDDVVIPLGITVKVRVDPLMVRNLTVFGTLTVNGAPTLQISGNFTNNGTFTPDTGTVTLTGDADQTLVATAPGALNFYKLTENKSATINTVTCASHLTVSKKLTLSKGKLVSASDYGDVFIEGDGELQLTSDITVSGNFTNNGALSGDYGITFDGGTEQNLSLLGVTVFYNLTVAAGTTLIETDPNDHAAVTGTLVNHGVLRKTQPVTTTGEYIFGLAGYLAGDTSDWLSIIVGELAEVNPLTAIQVDCIYANHPHAPGTNATDIYWTITPVGSDFTADLILPQANLPEPQIGRYRDGAWDWGNSGFDSVTIFRTNLTAFGDFAVFNNPQSATATVEISNLSQSYDGTAKPVTVTTDPANLAVSVTYDGSASAPSNAGSYTVIGTVTAPGYVGGATNTLVIGKATATVTLGSLSQTYDGTAKSVTANTAPASLSVDFTYGGSATAPTAAGSYTVVGTVTDPNYYGGVTNTLVVNPLPAVLTGSREYDGTADAAAAILTVSNAVAGDAVTVASGTATLADALPGARAITLMGTLALGGACGTNYTLTGASGSVTITSAPPGILSQPAGGVVGIGQSNGVSVTVTGTLPGYQWFKDGVKLVGQTSSSMSFASFQFTNSGSYQVVVTNAVGLVISQPVWLSVPHAPLKAWGYNNNGQLGNGSTRESNRPVGVTNDVVGVAAGDAHSLLVKADGTLWAMGNNQSGQLGNGSNSSTNQPVSVASNVVAVAAGYRYSLLVKADGTLWGMGDNGDGQLGNGSTSATNQPVSVASNVVAVAAGGYHSLFVKADGTLWVMGANSLGQLGNGTTSSTNRPVSVASNVVAVAAGNEYSLFVKADGTLWTMGYNGFGQLGNGSNSNTNRPVSVASNVVAVAAGSAHSLLVKADGTLWAMGYNGLGQLGNGSSIDTNRPVSVASNVVAVAAGGLHSLLVKADGTLWTMGFNGYGQLGNGSYSNTNRPVNVVGMTVASLGAMDRAYHSLAVATMTPQAANLTNQSITAYQSFTFYLVVTNGDVFAYQWQFQGTNLVGATNASYSVASATVADAGTYAVTFTDANGGTSQQSASLQVSKALATVTLSNLAQTYDGAAKLVSGVTSPTNLAVSVTYNGIADAPTNAGSYTVVGTINDPNYYGGATNTLVIAPAAAIVTLSHLSQIYDATAKSVSVTTDPLNLAFSVTYNGRVSAPTNVGSYSVIAIVTDANYRGTNTATGQITAKALTVTPPTIAAKGYDGSRTAGAVTVGTITGEATGQIVTATAVAADYASANVGWYSNVVVTYTLHDGSGGGWATNYSLAAGAATGQITPKALSVTYSTIAAKVYDGTNTAGAVTVGALSGFVSPEAVTATGMATNYASANVGWYSNVVITYTLHDGTGGGWATNYSLPAGTTTGQITPKALSVTNSTIAAKVYDGTNTAGAVTVGTLSGFVSPETVTATGTATNYASANVGWYSNVVVTYTLHDGTGGGWATNYSLATGTADGQITPKALSVTLSAIAAKVYNGTAIAGALTVGTLSSFVGSETVTVTGAAADYASANVGTYPGVVISYTLHDGTGGGLAGNYRLANGTASGQITAKALTVTAPAIAAKGYDATATAGAVTVGAVSGFVGSEYVSATGAAADYASADVGTYPGVVVTYTLHDGTGGGLAGNYSLANGTATGQITARALTVAGIQASDKVYDGTTNATLILTDTALVGNLDGTNVVLSTTNATGAFADPYVGINKTVWVSGLTLSGSATNNYTFTQPTTNATITGKPLTITANADAKTYGEVKLYGAGRMEFGTDGGDLVSGDNVTSVTLTCAEGGPATAAVGGYAIIPSAAVGIGLENYLINYQAGALTVGARGLNVTADADAKTYGTAKPYGPGQTTFSTGAGELVNGDRVSSVTLGSSDGGPATAVVGSYHLIASAAVGTGLGNYAIHYHDGALTVTTRALNITANGDSKTYGAVKVYGPGQTAFGTGAGELVNGDSVTNVTLACVDGGPATAAVGSYDLIASAAVGSGLGNYSLSYHAGTLRVLAASSVMTLASSVNPSVLGSNVTFTATVTPVAPATTTPGGSVQFYINGDACGSPVPLSGGVAGIIAAFYRIGTNHVAATYLPDGNYVGREASLDQLVHVTPQAPITAGITNSGGGTVTVSCSGTPYAEYVVQASASLVPPLWQNVSTNVAGADGRWTFEDASRRDPQRFYRAVRR